MKVIYLTCFAAPVNGAWIFFNLAMFSSALLLGQILFSEAKPSEIEHFCHNFAKIRRQFSPRKSTASTVATRQPLSPPPNPSKRKKCYRSPLPTGSPSSKARSNPIHVCNISNPSTKTETGPSPHSAEIHRPRACTISKIEFLTVPSGCSWRGWGSGGGLEFQGACGNPGRLMPTEAAGRVDKKGLGVEEEAGLSAEQRDAVAVVRGGGSLFLTGGAGTGKTFLLRKIIKVLPPESTFATASTGTLHYLKNGTKYNSTPCIHHANASDYRIGEQCKFFTSPGDVCDHPYTTNQCSIFQV